MKRNDCHKRDTGQKKLVDLLMDVSCSGAVNEVEEKAHDQFARASLAETQSNKSFELAGVIRSYL